MKLEVEICTMEVSVLTSLVNHLMVEFAIDNGVHTPADLYVKSNLCAQLENLENLKLLSYHNVSTYVGIENKLKSISHEGENNVTT